MDTCLKAADSVLDTFKGQGFEFPKALWDNCKAVVIISEGEGGFLVTVGEGAGVIVPKKEDGSWGNPCAISVTSFSIGAVIGATQKKIVLFPMTDYALKTYAESEGKFDLGLNAGLAIGPVGRETALTLATDYDAKPSITYSYFIEKGAWVSVAIPSTTIEHDDAANERFYGTTASGKNVTGTILLSGKEDIKAPKGKGVEELIAKLDSFKCT